MREVHEKIDYEYEIFYLGMMSHSKADIFARSKEIETKKRIYRFLLKNVGEDEKMLLIDNLMDEIYRKISDFEKDEDDHLLKKILDDIRKDQTKNQKKP